MSYREYKACNILNRFNFLILISYEDVYKRQVKEFVTTPVSVFFNINRTNIASQKDLVNVAAIAKYRCV